MSASSHSANHAICLMRCFSTKFSPELIESRREVKLQLQKPISDMILVLYILLVQHAPAKRHNLEKNGYQRPNTRKIIFWRN